MFEAKLIFLIRIPDLGEYTAFQIEIFSNKSIPMKNVSISASKESQFLAFSRFKSTHSLGFENDRFKQDLALYFDENCIEKPVLSNYSVEVILDYLRQSHAYYQNVLMPRLQMAITAFDKNFSNHPATNVLSMFYNNYQNELLEHIELEEKKLFPYAEQLLAEKQEYNYSIAQFGREHNHEIEDRLQEVLITIKEQFPEVKSDFSFKAFEHLLERFSNDLAIHHYIEEMVFIEKLRILELNR